MYLLCILLSNVNNNQKKYMNEQIEKNKIITMNKRKKNDSIVDCFFYFTVF